MSVRFGAPSPPKIHHPELYLLGIVVTLVGLLLATYIVDKLGTAMFKRGFAKPFYIKGRRVHHSCLYFIVPAGYAIFLAFYFLGFIQILWSSLYSTIFYAIVILAITMTIDFLGDRFWPKIRKNVILHHEWIYTLVPAYVLTYAVVVII
ncbi:MAG: hypothetical protein JRN20_06705 [Nitrososphaerota archaeon]|nr:hypothetical protein [Nitrososphaerota archaeon]